jgi:hypothetical protein
MVSFDMNQHTDNFTEEDGASFPINYVFTVFESDVVTGTYLNSQMK